MDKITKIEIQKNNKDRVNIYVNDEYFMAIYSELIYKFNIKKNDIVNKESLQEILDKENYLKAKNKALNILTKCDQSKKHVKDKLSKDFDEHIIEQVIDFLEKNKLINDDLLAQKIINTNINFNKYGKNKIKQNLYKKGIENLSNLEIDEDKELENAVFLANKKYDKVKNLDKNKIKQKLYQHLTYRGFDFEITKQAINSVLSDNF
ncbi:MAG: recombination regulator RecX [Peptostreptococcaceae bacterium]